MRLDLVRQILKENAGSLTVNSESIDHNNNAKLSGILSAIKAVRRVQDTGMFNKLCQSLLAKEVISLAAHEPIVVSAGVASDFTSKLHDLATRVRYVLDALDGFVIPLPPDCVRVKLPATSDLEAAARVEIEINKLLNQVLVNDYLGGSVSLQAFTQGSLWVDICLGSAAAFRFLAGLVGLFFDVKQRQVQQSAREVAFQDLSLSAEVRKSLFDAMKAEVDGYRQTRIRQLLESSNVPSGDHEFQLRVENSLKMLGALLDKGLEIHPSLTSPVEERQLFPDPKRILEAIKALPSGRDAKEDSGE